MVDHCELCEILLSMSVFLVKLSVLTEPIVFFYIVLDMSFVKLCTLSKKTFIHTENPSIEVIRLMLYFRYVLNSRLDNKP